ncbi:MAG: phytoene/squalene synthase family protein [Oceanicaulis sp.]
MTCADSYIDDQARTPAPPANMATQSETAPQAPCADAVLARHGRSFHFARRLLGRAHGARATRLYAACRAVDDIADETRDAAMALHRLKALKTALARRDDTDAVAAVFLELHRACGLDLAAAQVLVNGAIEDLGLVALEDEQDLLGYAYKVAGCVGLMMCPVLGVANPAARPYAADLGVAMQLTNIARDVFEDAHMGRRYLPASWVDARPEDITAIVVEPGTAPETGLRSELRGAVRRLLALADRYYQSGQAGLAYLPPRPRLSILVAARIYRAIGARIAAMDHEPWRARAIVSGPRKSVIAAKAGAEFMTRGDLHDRPGPRAHELAAWPSGAAHAGAFHG